MILTNLSAQDDCSSATPEGTIGCETSFTVTGPGSMTSDIEAVGCMIGLNGGWFTFDFDPSVTEFMVSGTNQYNLFEGSCAGLNLVSDCLDGTYTVVASSDYYILVNEAEDVTITTPAIPSNEDCGSAEVLSGSMASTNICASATGSCESGGSVWFEIDVPDDFTELEVSVSGGTISSPAVSIYDACGGTQVDGMNCSGTATASCIVAGTYYVEVVSPSGDEGTFTISETQTVVANEICDDAIDAGLLTCDLTVTGTGVAGACPGWCIRLYVGIRWNMV